VEVDQAGDLLLARAGLARDEDRHLGRRDALNQPPDVDDGKAVHDEGGQTAVHVVPP
jgi:hypothetical protein